MDVRERVQGGRYSFYTIKHFTYPSPNTIMMMKLRKMRLAI